MPCKSSCRATSPLSQSFHREILPPFLIVSLLISFAKPFWLWMHSSIYADWQWLSKRTLTLLPLNFLESAGGLSVLIPSDFIATFFWFQSLLLICISFLSYFLLSIPHCSRTSSSKLSENTFLKKLFDNWLCWWVDGKVYALEDFWNKDHHPSSLQSAHFHQITRPLPKTQEWTDHWYQCIQMYVITSNIMAILREKQSPRRKDVQLTIRQFCFSAPLTAHFLSFPMRFFILISFFSIFFSSSFFFSFYFALLLLESTFLPLGQAYIDYQCQKIK